MKITKVTVIYIQLRNLKRQNWIQYADRVVPFLSMSWGWWAVWSYQSKKNQNYYLKCFQIC